MSRLAASPSQQKAGDEGELQLEGQGSCCLSAAVKKGSGQNCSFDRVTRWTGFKMKLPGGMQDRVTLKNVKRGMMALRDMER